MSPCLSPLHVSGYIIPATEVPQYWKWFVTLNPFYFCYRGTVFLPPNPSSLPSPPLTPCPPPSPCYAGLAVNEFLSKRYQSHPRVPSGASSAKAGLTLGQTVLRLRGIEGPDVTPLAPVYTMLCNLALTSAFILLATLAMNQLHHEPLQSGPAAARKRDKRRRERQLHKMQSKQRIGTSARSHGYGGNTRLDDSQSSVLSSYHRAPLDEVRSTKTLESQ